MKENSEPTDSPATEMLKWVRAAAHPFVLRALQDSLPDAKSRRAYQMSDGTKTADEIRIACQLGGNTIVELHRRCVSRGLMEVIEGKRRRRLFDLADFGLVEDSLTEPKALEVRDGEKAKR